MMMMRRKHELRGWEGSVLVCESCEGSPAVFVCKADDAFLCAACDTLIHSANPLARRHHRLPIYQDDDNTTTTTTTNNNNSNDDPYFLGADVDQYLDLLDYTSAPASDTLVPLHLDFDINSSNATTNTETVSLSSLDAGIVPQAAISEISTPNQLPNTHLFSSHLPQQQPMQLLQSSMDRQARVMRYRQKKKSRKFDKTIRYASRKAYAETRPRIKGRFVKRNHDHQLPISPHDGYALVPSF